VLETMEGKREDT